MAAQDALRRTAAFLTRTVRHLFRDEREADALEPCPYCNTWGPWQARVCKHCGAILMSSASWKEFFREE